MLCSPIGLDVVYEVMYEKVKHSARSSCRRTNGVGHRLPAEPSHLWFPQHSIKIVAQNTESVYPSSHCLRCSGPSARVNAYSARVIRCNSCHWPRHRLHVCMAGATSAINVSPPVTSAVTRYFCTDCEASSRLRTTVTPRSLGYLET